MLIFVEKAFLRTLGPETHHTKEKAVEEKERTPTLHFYQTTILCVDEITQVVNDSLKTQNSLSLSLSLSLSAVLPFMCPTNWWDLIGCL